MTRATVARTTMTGIVQADASVTVAPAFQVEIRQSGESQRDPNPVL
jgi:hypothetical protein